MPDLGAYQRQAVALAREPVRLRALRERIEANRATTPLFDTPRYARNFEAALDRMVALREAGRPPEAFSIEDRDVQPDAGPAVAEAAFALSRQDGRVSAGQLFVQIDALCERRAAESA